MQFLLANGNMVLDMEEVDKFGQMDLNMKDIGQIIWQMVEED